jgi:hypothetical protein
VPTLSSQQAPEPFHLVDVDRASLNFEALEQRARGLCPLAPLDLAARVLVHVADWAGGRRRHPAMVRFAWTFAPK